MKNLWMSVVLVAGLIGFQAQAADNDVEAKSLSELLQLVKDGKVVTLNVEGPGKFEVSDADTLLAQAKA